MAKLNYTNEFLETPNGTVITVVTTDDKGAYLGQSSAFVQGCVPDKKGEKLEVKRK